VSSEPFLQSDLRRNFLDVLAPTKFVFADRALAETSKEQIQQKLAQSLQHPLDYPALKESVFAGDKIAIALQNGLPSPEIVVTGLLESLFEIGIEPADIVVVADTKMASVLGLGAEEIESASNPLVNEAPQPTTIQLAGLPVNLLVHNRLAQSSVSYLAANDAGDPVYLNRYLVDADVVLPIGFPLTNCEDAQDSLYPGFSNDQTQTRFQTGDVNRLAKESEIQLANDTLGAFFTIQVIEGPGGGIERVISGARNLVQTESRKIANQVWRYHGPKNCEVVVATIESTAGNPTWENFVQAVTAANHIASVGSPIVVWSGLVDRPGKHIRQALLAQFDFDAKKRLPDWLIKFADILKSHPIYLRSRLSRNEVESLGLGFLDSAEQINRIAENSNQGIVLRDAHKYHFSTQSPAKRSARKTNRQLGKGID
jgi:hypothetical protein